MGKIHIASFNDQSQTFSQAEQFIKRRFSLAADSSLPAESIPQFTDGSSIDNWTVIGKTPKLEVAGGSIHYLRTGVAYAITCSTPADEKGLGCSASVTFDHCLIYDTGSGNKLREALQDFSLPHEKSPIFEPTLCNEETSEIVYG